MAQSRQYTLLSLIAGQIRPTVKAAAGVATWTPGMALPGMSMAQTKAYQSKIPKPAAGGVTGAPRPQPMSRATLSSAYVARQSAVPNAGNVMSANPKMTAAFQSSRRDALGSAWAARQSAIPNVSKVMSANPKMTAAFQSGRRDALSSAYVARQSAVSPSVLRDMALVRGGGTRGGFGSLGRGIGGSTGRGAPVLNSGIKPTVLGGTSRGTVLGGNSRGTVLRGTSRGTVLGGTSRGTVLGGTSRGTVLGKTAETRTDVNGRKYNLLQAMRTPSYTVKPPSSPKTVTPDVQYGMPKAVTPGSDSTKPTSSGSEAPQPVKVAQQSKEWDAAMASLRTGRRAPVQPRGVQGPIYPTSPKLLPRTGDSYYDNLQSTKDRLEREAIAQREQEVFRKSNIQQEKTPEQIQQEMKGFKTWGESASPLMTKVINDHPLARAVRFGGKALGYAFSAPKGTSWSDWSKQYNQSAAQDRGAIANDTLNNWQGMWEGAKRSAGNSVRGVVSLGSHVVPGGNSYRMKKFRQGLANATANADALHDARRDVLQSKYQTGLQDADSGLGIANNITRDFIGNLAGETAAMGAMGGAAGVGAKAIRGASGVAGRVAGNAVTKAVQPAMQKMRYVQSGFGNTAKNLAAAEGRAGMAPTTAARNAYARTMTSGGVRDRAMMMQRAGRPINMQSPHFGANFEERLGGAVNDSFRMVGDVMAKPLQLGADAVSGFGNNLGGAARGMSSAAMHPLRTLGQVVRAPGNAIRASRQAIGDFGRNFAMHPWQSTWRGAKRVGRFAVDPKVWAYGQMPGVYGDVSSGDYGDAVRGMGTMGSGKFLWSAPGVVSAPLFVRDARNLVRE